MIIVLSQSVIVQVGVRGFVIYSVLSNPRTVFFLAPPLAPAEGKAMLHTALPYARNCTLCKPGSRFLDSVPCCCRYDQASCADSFRRSRDIPKRLARGSLPLSAPVQIRAYGPIPSYPAISIGLDLHRSAATQKPYDRMPYYTWCRFLHVSSAVAIDVCFHITCISI
jgi:hypothetical protein